MAGLIFAVWYSNYMSGTFANITLSDKIII